MRNPDIILNTTPHYTNEYFRYERTVFGEIEDGLNYEYFDHFWKRNYIKAKKSATTANLSCAKPKTARWYQIFLSDYLSQNVEIKHILTGWNWNTGYPYILVGYNKFT